MSNPNHHEYNFDHLWSTSLTHNRASRSSFLLVLLPKPWLDVYHDSFCSHTAQWEPVTVWPPLFDVCMQELWVQGHFPLLWPYTRGQSGSQASVELLKARGDQATVSPLPATSFSLAPSSLHLSPAPSWPHGRSPVQVCPETDQETEHFHSSCLHVDSGYISLSPHVVLQYSKMSFKNI